MIDEYHRCMLEDRFPEDVRRCGKEAVDLSEPLWQPEKTTTLAGASGGGQLDWLARNITRRRWRHRIERGFHASARQDAPEEMMADAEIAVTFLPNDDMFSEPQKQDRVAQEGVQRPASLGHATGRCEGSTEAGA